MFSAKVFLTLGFIAVVSAGPMMGGHGGPMGGPFAELEKTLTEEQKQQIQAIFKDETSSKQQIQDNVKAFFEKLGGDALTQYNALKTKMDSMKNDFMTKADTASAGLTSEAQNIVSKIKAVKEDMTLTMAQDHEQTKALYDGASDSVKQELKGLKGELFGNHEGHHHRTTSAPVA